MIDKKLLNFKRDGLEVDILFNKLNKKHITLMITFCKEHNQWETYTINIPKIDGVTRNNPVSISREMEKSIVKSSNEGEDLKFEQG